MEDQKLVDLIKSLVKQVINGMADDEEILASEVNMTGDVAGYDAPLSTKKQKRKFIQDEED